MRRRRRLSSASMRVVTRDPTGHGGGCAAAAAAVATAAAAAASATDSSTTEDQRLPVLVDVDVSRALWSGGHRRRFSIASATVWQLRRPLGRQPGWAAAACSVASERAGVIRSLKTGMAFADAPLHRRLKYPTRQRGEPRGRPRFTEGRQPGSPPARASSFRFIMKMQSRPHVHLHCEPPLRGRGRPRPGPTRDT